MEPYQYKPIPHPAYLDTTRLLTLHPGPPSAPLGGTLRLMKLTDPVPFAALSYVWGPAGSAKEPITCHGRALQVTSGLAAALRRIRLREAPRVVWVDQVCINQADSAERSQQIRHMNAIYVRAARVLVWLGDDERGRAEKAFALVRALRDAGRDPRRLRDLEAAGEDLDWFGSDLWRALGELFKQAWFDRKWILQEIGTDAPALLHWGAHVLDWDDLAEAAALLKNHGYALRRRWDLQVWKPWYMHRLFSPSSYDGGEKRPLDFVYELHRARWQRASDPRDHVFALLGHPSAFLGDGMAVMEADYTKPVAAVYHELAVRMLRGAESLIMLNVVQHAAVESSDHKDLPTWVTRWDSQTHLYNLFGDVYTAFRASKDIRPDPVFSDSDRVLALDGAVVDTLATTSRVLTTDDLHPDSPTVAELWKSLHATDLDPDSGPSDSDLDSDSDFTTKKAYPPSLANPNTNTSTQEPEPEPLLHAFLETLSAVKKRTRQPPVPLRTRLADGFAFLVDAYGPHRRRKSSGTGTGIGVGDDVVRAASEGDGDSGGGDSRAWMERASGGANGRRFGVGNAGYFALVPPAAEVGDRLCLLLGGKTLFCLRPLRGGGEGDGDVEGDGDREDCYLFVGECYVHGVMDGEAVERMERGEVEMVRFSIR